MSSHGSQATETKKMTTESTPIISAAELGTEVSKEAIRQKVWDYLEQNDLVEFPRPVYHRIPNFKGAATAADKIPSLEVFQKANTVKVNPDKPQEQARFLTMEANKTLLVPTQRLRSGLFNKIVPPEGANKEELRKCATSQGVKNSSKPIGLDDKVTVDLVITGSVAVSPKGWRIGKGEGYADLEWGMMRCMDAVTADTIVVTTVHDCQVVDDLPDDLFQVHDVTVDFILTPTRLIECEKKPKPEGMYWSLLTKQRLHDIPVLKKLRAIEEKAGKDVTLKPMPEKPADEKRDAGRSEENGEDGSPGKNSPSGKRERRRRPPRRGPRRSKSDSESGRQSDYESSKKPAPEGSPNERPNRRRQQISDTSSIFVGSIPRSCRVSTFKTAIRDKGVAPLRVIWHGGNGHAFLQFEKFDEAEDAMARLEGLEIRERELRIEFSNRTKQKKDDGNEQEVDGATSDSPKEAAQESSPGGATEAQDSKESES